MTGLRPRLTAEDILSRYAAGERTFSGVDLAGEKLRGADLSGIDLSDSDLRSTDLRDANLSSANLTGCRMGRTPRWWLLHIMFGLTIGILLVFLIAHIEQIIVIDSIWRIPIVLFLAIIFITVPILYISKCFPPRLVYSLLLIPFLALIPFSFLKDCGVGKRIAITPGILLLLSTWGLSWRAVRKAGRDASPWKGESYWLARIGSTSLQSTNLTDADLSKVAAWGAKFGGARLVRTRFAGAIDLDGAFFDREDLDSIEAKELARTLDGSGKDYHGKRLAEISLAGANLERANLRGCELQGADLSGAQLNEAVLTGACIDWVTFERSGWTADDLMALHKRGVLITGLDVFSEEVRAQLLGAQEGLTLYFNAQLVAWDRYLVDGVIFGVLGKETDCQVTEFRNLKDRNVAVVRLVARRREDLEQVAEALYRRIWEQEQEQQTALFRLVSLAQGTEVREGLSDLMSRRLERMELREKDSLVPSRLFPADRARLRWALILGSGGERFEGVRPRRLFLHHAPEDHTHASELRKHLTLLQHQGLVATDIEPLPGEDLAAELQARLDEADVVLALLSVDYFSSAACQQQLRQALQRRQDDGLCVVPVLLRPVDWEDSPLAGLNPLPADGHPVAQRQDRDGAWQVVISGLRRLLRERF